MTIRVVHYNVMRLTQYDAVARTLEALKPDIVTLNEIDAAAASLERLAARLGLQNAHFFGHSGGSYGNAILCNGGSIAARVRLDGGTRIGSRRIERGMLVVTGTSFRGAVACTHLDHVSEAERVVQTRSVLDALGRYDSVLLAADLNALRRDDYNIDEWTRLERRNRSNGWVAPVDSSLQGGVLDELNNAGFVDLGGHRGRVDFTSTSHCGGVPCQRIDYVHANRSALQRHQVTSVTVDVDATGSDHLPLVVDIKVLRPPHAE